jgi:hypothetical protein
MGFQYHSKIYILSFQATLNKVSLEDLQNVCASVEEERVFVS